MIFQHTRDAHHEDVRRGPRRFDAVTIALHWTTAILVLFMFATALLRDPTRDGEHAQLLLTIHRCLGLTVWAIAICRLGWRLGFAFLPPFPPTMSKTHQTLAKLSEYGLYAFLLIQPLTGLAQSLTRGHSFVLFGWDVPAIMAKNDFLTALFHQIHEISAFTLLSLIGLHVLAVLFHSFVLRDEVLASMLPFKISFCSVAFKIFEGLGMDCRPNRSPRPSSNDRIQQAVTETEG